MADNEKLPAGAARAGPANPTDDRSAEDTRFNAYAVDRLSLAFENSARRWELIVYPSLFAFILLAAYGFYLVFSLAKDIHYLAKTVDTSMMIVASNMQVMSDNVAQMSANVRTMAVSVDSMSRDVATLEPILTSMQSMDQAIRTMTLTTGNMRDDMAVMNRNISRPMSFVNSFVPW
jgi:methyl-accepting chemotaxis protein